MYGSEYSPDLGNSSFDMEYQTPPRKINSVYLPQKTASFYNSAAPMSDRERQIHQEGLDAANDNITAWDEIRKKKMLQEKQQREVLSNYHNYRNIGYSSLDKKDKDKFLAQIDAEKDCYKYIAAIEKKYGGQSKIFIKPFQYYDRILSQDKISMEIRQVGTLYLDDTEVSRFASMASYSEDPIEVKNAKQDFENSPTLERSLDRLAVIEIAHYLRDILHVGVARTMFPAMIRFTRDEFSWLPKLLSPEDFHYISQRIAEKMAEFLRKESQDASEDGMIKQRWDHIQNNMDEIFGYWFQERGFINSPAIKVHDVTRGFVITIFFPKRSYASQTF